MPRIRQKCSHRIVCYRNKNGDPMAAVRRDGVGAVTEGTSSVELRGDPGHRNQRQGRGDDMDVQVARPRQILQVGIADKVDRHQRTNDLAYGRLLYK